MLDHVLDCICAYTKSFELRDATSRDDSTGGVCVLQRPCHVPVCTIGISTNHHQIRPKTTGMVGSSRRVVGHVDVSQLTGPFLPLASVFLCCIRNMVSSYASPCTLHLIFGHGSSPILADSCQERRYAPVFRVVTRVWHSLTFH